MTAEYKFNEYSKDEHLAIEKAYQAGDFDGLKSALRNPADFPNSRGPCGDVVLGYAIFHSPIAFIRTLLERGANPNYEDDCGYPSLISAVSAEREDKLEVIDLLLSYSADIQQRGVNDFTPLHQAVVMDDAEAAKLLLDRGADPNAKTRIDEYATPLEEAVALNRANSRVAEVLRQFMAQNPTGL